MHKTREQPPQGDPLGACRGLASAIVIVVGSAIVAVVACLVIALIVRAGGR